MESKSTKKWNGSYAFRIFRRLLQVFQHLERQRSEPLPPSKASLFASREGYLREKGRNSSIADSLHEVVQEEIQYPGNELEKE